MKTTDIHYESAKNIQAIIDTTDHITFICPECNSAMKTEFVILDKYLEEGRNEKCTIIKLACDKCKLRGQRKFDWNPESYTHKFTILRESHRELKKLYGAFIGEIGKEKFDKKFVEFSDEGKECKYEGDELDTYVKRRFIAYMAAKAGKPEQKEMPKITLTEITKEELMEAISDGVSQAFSNFGAGYVSSGTINDAITEGTRQALDK